MTLGEVCLLTDNVVKLASFYKQLLKVDNSSSDHIHQTIISEETTLTIYNDGAIRTGNYQNICLAFTCNSVDREYEKLTALGVEIIEKPKVRPWGTKNMSFRDPAGNLIFLREFISD